MLKQTLFPLRLKRKDPTFGNIEKDRGQQSRNEFVNKGTKKAGLEFFSFPAIRFLFWGGFELAVKESADLLEQYGKENHVKLRKLLDRFKKKLRPREWA